MASSKIDKISGDIRMCFEVIRETVQRKLDSNNFTLPIGPLDVNEVLIHLFESKIVKIVKKLPRAHILMLNTIIDWIEQVENTFLIMDSCELVNKYNFHTKNLMIEKVNLAEVHDILQTLEQSDIVVYASNCKEKVN